MLYNTTLYHTMLHYTTLHDTMLYYTILYYDIVILHYVFDPILYIALHWSITVIIITIPVLKSPI